MCGSLDTYQTGHFCLLNQRGNLMHKTILASAVILAFAHTAIAAEFTYTYGNDSSIQTGSVTEDTVVNVTKESLTSSDGYMQAVTGSPEQVNERVTLTINTADRFIGVLAGSGTTYTNNGTIIVNGDAANYWKIKAMVAAGGTIENAGTIEVTNAYGMQGTASSGGTIINSGKIIVHENAVAIDGDANSSSSARSETTNTGDIVLTGASSTGVLIGRGDSFTNSGTISGSEGTAIKVTEGTDGDSQESLSITLSGNSRVEGIFKLTEYSDVTVTEDAIHQTVRLADDARNISNNSSLTIEQADPSMGLEIASITTNTGAATDILMHSAGTKDNPVLVVKQTSGDGSVAVGYSGTVSDSINAGETQVADLLAGATINGETLTETTVAEGQWGNALSVTTDDSGNVVTRVTSENSLLRSAKDLAKSHAVVWRSELSSLTDRMATLRTLPESVGTWARYTGGNLEGDNVDFDFNSIEVGFDTRVTDTMTIGVSFGYTNGDNDLAAGSAETDAYKLGLYASYMNESGSFLDAMLKVGRIDADFDLNNGYAEKGDYMYSGVIAGVEVGHHFKLNSFFVEPQVQLTYSYLAAETTTTNVRTIEFDSMKSLIARVGVMGGVKFAENRGAAYVSAHYNHDFLGDVDGSFYNASQRVSFGEELDSDWGVVSVGADYDFTNTFKGFVDLSRSFGGDIEEKWRVNLGARYMF